MLEREEVRRRKHQIETEQEELNRLQDLLTERTHQLQTQCSHAEQENREIGPDMATICMVCGKLLELKPHERDEEE